MDRNKENNHAGYRDFGCHSGRIDVHRHGECPIAADPHHATLQDGTSGQTGEAAAPETALPPAEAQTGAMMGATPGTTAGTMMPPEMMQMMMQMMAQHHPGGAMAMPGGSSPTGAAAGGPAGMEGFAGVLPEAILGLGSAAPLEMTPDLVRSWLQDRLDRLGNPRLKLGEIGTAADGSITAEIRTSDGALVQKLAFNRYPGLFRQID